MRIETRSGGWNAVFRATGAGRYFSAAFLLAWLCGWAAGEIAVGWVLFWIATTGFSKDVPNAPSLTGGALVVLFLLVWFSFWTLGGLGAFRELLRLLFGSDRIGVVRGRLRVEHRAGPARWGREFEVAQLAEISVRRKDAALVATLVNGSEVPLTGLGSKEERERLAEKLRSELHLPEPGTSTPRSRAEHAPAGWEADLTPELAVVLRPARSTRRAQGGCLSVVLFALVALLAAVLSERVSSGAWSGGTVIAAAVLGLLAALAGVGAARLLFGREEWRFKDGAAEFYRAFAGRERRERFEDAALLLASHVDSDGDEHLTLTVQAGTAQRKLTSSIGPGALRVAEWISEHGGLRMQPPPSRRSER